MGAISHANLYWGFPLLDRDDHPIINTVGFLPSGASADDHSSHPSQTIDDDDNDDGMMFLYHDGGGNNNDKNSTTDKKLNHNMSERDRRKRINSLYASLRSLLPPQDHSKKLSIPTTVSRVLKYIPELQEQVQNLIRKKEALISSRVSNNNNNNQNPNSSSLPLALAAVSATRISEDEMVVQWSVVQRDGERGTLFETAIERLEGEGFLVINASCFQSFGSRVFYTLHLEGQGDKVMDAGILKKKVISFCNKNEHIITY